VTAIATILSGITSLAAWLRGLFRKSTMNSTAKSEVNTGGGTFDESTDSLEASAETAAAVKTIIDAANTLDGKTLQQVLRYMAAAVAGKASGAGTGTETFKGLDGTTSRITATVDTDGNRTAIVYDP
jgi:hypothetical protein